MRNFLLLCSLLTGHFIAYSQVLVKNINPIPTIGSVSDKFIMVEMNGKGYFNADDGTHGMELWVTDGTEAGTQMVKDIHPSSMVGGINFQSVNEQWVPVVLNDKIYFPAFEDGNGIELWVSDGTEQGTNKLIDINSNGGAYVGGLNNNNLFVHDGFIWFSAYDDDFYTGLWKSDGTAEGTTLVKQLYNGFQNISSFTPFNNELWFCCNNSLWRTDGTEAGTVMLQGFQSMTFGRNDEMKVLGDALYFMADNSIGGMELWKVNSLYEISELDIIPGFEGVTPTQLTVFNNNLYFVGYDVVHQNELWISNGTLAGTEMLTEINPNGSAHINFPQNAYAPLIIFNGAMWFSAYTDGFGRELWRSDGTAAGTERMTDLTTAAAGSTPSKMVVHDNQLFFSAFHATEGRQLHSIDMNDELTTHFQNGYNDQACCAGNMFSIAGNLLMPGNYDYDDEIRDELYKLGTVSNVIENMELNATLHVYPSLVKDLLTFKTEGLIYPIALAVVAMDGKVIEQMNVTTSQAQSINVNSLASGIYMLTCVDANGQRATAKWMKE